MTPNSLPDENTSGLDEARKAVARARSSSQRADSLISRTQRSLAQVKETREVNHFADKFRAIIQGGYTP